MNYVDIHQFNFLVRSNLNYIQLDEITTECFNIKLSEFKLVKKYRNYYRRYYTFNNMINIYINGAGDNVNTTFFEIHGSACDTLNIEYIKLSKRCLNNSYKLSSLHIYIDDTKDILPIERISTEFIENSKDRIISNFKTTPTLISSDSKSIYFGSNKSDTQVLFYDKGRFEKVEFKWIRVEIRISDNEIICNMRIPLKAASETDVMAATIPL